MTSCRRRAGKVWPFEYNKLVHRDSLRSQELWINHGIRIGKPLIGRQILVGSQTVHPRFSVNKLCISIRCRFSEFVYDVPSSLKERSRQRRLKDCPVCFQDNPRRLGKDRVRLVGPVPLKLSRKVRRGGSIHQFLWHVRKCQTRMRDLRPGTIEKPFRVESSSSGRFRA